MDEIKTSPRSRISGAIADALLATKRTADKVDVPVIGKLGQAFLGNVPEEVDNWSYGNAPFAMPPSGTGGYIPVTKTGRAQNIADTLTTGLPMAGTALKGAAKVADAASTAAVRKILGNSAITPTQVMDIAGSLIPSPAFQIQGVNKTNPKHLEKVMQEMQELGAPKIRAYWDGEQYKALEGSHRIEAAYKLGITPEIEEVTLKNWLVNHDLYDLPEKTSVLRALHYLQDTDAPSYFFDFD